jgi:hypothetical protein
MSDFERRLRDAMAAAAEAPPAGLIDAIRRRHRRHVRRLGTACVAAVAAVGIAVPLITHGVTGGSAGRGPAGGGPAAPATSPAAVMPTATPTSVPTAAPGTVLRDCQNNNNGTLNPDWKAQSIHAGPVWFMFARGSKSFPRGQRLARGLVTAGAFVIAVSNGRTAIVTDAPAAARRFRFLAGFTGSSAYRTRVGAPGLTLVGCPPGPPGTDIPESYAPGLTMFWQGYVNNLGSCIPLEVRTPSARQPIRVTLGAATNGTCGS